ncbi:MAG: hypothetical protein CMB65_05880 [Euryarchaeota archaeon]|nr:hypothetical protein [Euryarchaeota archaeon]
MSDEKDDSVIRERRFKIGANIDIGDLGLGEDSEEVPDSNLFALDENETVEVDEALGDVFDPFKEASGEEAGAISSDGTVTSAPEDDIVTSMAKDGERRVNWSLMVSMIFVFSLLSVVAGTAFPPLISLVLLLILAITGFALGERWIPDKNLHLLGVSWVIISMKVLYGLAIELNRWELGDFLPISVELLAIVLLLLVALNVFIAYRHDHDAIAAQATLVLLAIGSTAGSIGGELGVAVMILLATLLLHGLALHRESGNLAALGVAASNLWIGMHAITDGFTAGSLVIEPLDTPLILFLLLMLVSGINSGMAARFAREDNWFSQGFKAAGLGQPGLWGVSISLGMVGALMAVASSREDSGYALGMVTFLAGAFGGSYLIVRGVERLRIAIPLMSGAILFSLLLIFGETTEAISLFDRYETFTIFAAILTGFVILRDQNRVTDRVLWVGSVGVLVLLVVLIPAQSEANGGDGGLVLLGLLTTLHIGTAILAIMRQAPSLAGATVLLPWTWVLLQEFVVESFRTVMIANGWDDPGNIIDLATTPFAVYLIISVALMLIVNLQLGKTGVNLAAGFLGITEVSASIRDSGVLQLWAIGLWLPMVTIVVMAHAGSFTAITLLAVVSVVSLSHLGAQFFGKRLGGPIALLGVIAVSAAVLGWRHGLDEIWIILLLIATASILYRGDPENEPVFTNGMALMSLPLIIAISTKDPSRILDSTDSIPNIDLSLTSVTCTGLVMGFYLPRAEKMEKLLKPAAAALWLLMITIGLSIQLQNQTSTMAGIGLFAFSTLWLVARGEIRAELKTITQKEQLLAIAGQDNVKKLSLGAGQLDTYDPKRLELQQKRKKRRELTATEDDSELYTTDVSHRPTIVLLVLFLVLGSVIVWGLLFSSSPLILLSAGIFATVLVAIARLRTKQLDLDLPTVMGIEMPIAYAIIGLIVALISGHLGPGASNTELLDLAVVTILILQFVIISLYQRDNLLDRIPIAIDWFVLPLVLGRIAGALLVESLPFPFTVNPFDGGLIGWQIPWLLLEALLILTIVIDLMIDSRRSSVGRDTHLSSSGRGLRALGYVMISWGPAGILAVANAIYTGRKHRQVEAVGLAIICLPLALFSMGTFIPQFIEYLDWIMLAGGFVMLGLVAASVPMRNGHWTMMAAIDSHVLMFAGLILVNIWIIYPIALFAISTTLWVVGIFHLRRVLRIWGFVDLILGIAASLLMLGAASSINAIGLFLLLTVVGAELALVTWLGQRHQEALSQD